MGFLLYHKVVETSYHVVAILLNVLLLLIVHKFTPKRMSDYKWMFQITCVSDLFLSAAVLAWQFVALWDDGIFVVFSNSFFSPSSPTVSFWVVIVGCHALYLNFTFVPVPFVYRYLQVHRYV